MTDKMPNPTKTVLTISVGFGVIYLLTQQNWALYVALCVGLIGVISDFLARQITFLWMKLGWVLSLIVPNIILTIIFFLFLFPVAQLAKLTRKNDALQLNRKEGSTFVDVTKSFDKASFEKPF